MKDDNHSYKGWLNSDHFWKRALAVVGYSLVGQFIIILALAALAVLPWSFVSSFLF